MAKDRIYAVPRGSVSDNYAQIVKTEPSGTTLSLDAILEDCETIMAKQENEEYPTDREDTQ